MIPLARFFALEYAVLFDLVNPGLCALDLPMALGGTSNHFRMQALRDVGGWDPWNVTEDLDIGLRLARRGRRIDALASDTTEEAPHEFRNWFAQRVRWQKGWMQTLIVHSRRPRRFWRELGPRRAASATVMVAGAVLAGLFGPIFALDTLWRALSSAGAGLTAWREATDVFVYLLALTGLQSIVIPALVARRRRQLDLPLAAFVALPAYYALISAATWVALLDLVVRPFHWSKTAHGRTRSRRRLRPEAGDLRSVRPRAD